MPAAVAFDTTPRAGQHQRQLIDIQAAIKMRVEAAADATDEQRAKTAQATEHFARMGPMKMKLKMEQTMKVGQPDADASKGGQVDVGGKVSPLPAKGQDLSFTARFNPKDFAFEIQGVQGAPALDDAMRTQGNAMIGEALQLYKVLAQQPLKVGESVDVPMTMALPIPMPDGAGSLQSKLRYTLARVERGTAHFDLGMDMTMDAKAPLPAAAASAPAPDAAPQATNVAVAGRGRGTSSLRLADRLPLASALKMTLTMTMKMPDGSLMHMDMEMDMRAKGESLAKPAAARKKN